MENNTAKHFVLQLGSLLSLYLSLTFLIVLLFGIINLVIPDATDYYYIIEGYNNSVRLGIAMVVVFFPTYIILTRFVNKMRRQSASNNYLGLTKWLIYLSLLVGGGVLLGDLVAVIMTFLNGEITARFILKATVVLVVIGLAFYYYINDAKGSWVKNERFSVLFGVLATIAVLISLGLGLANVQTPAIVREMKLDEKQVQDLQQIQSAIENQLAASSSLPATLEIAFDNFTIPTAPTGRAQYQYNVTNEGFELCANFSYPSPGDTSFYPSPVDINRPIKNPDSWQHPAGQYCYQRIVQR